VEQRAGAPAVGETAGRERTGARAGDDTAGRAS
jgi:hypothetical protein